MDRWAAHALAPKPVPVRIEPIETPPNAQGEQADRLLRSLAGQARGAQTTVGVRLGDGSNVAEALMLFDRIVQELGRPCAALGFLDDDLARTSILAGRVEVVRPSVVDGSATGPHDPSTPTPIG